MTETIESEGSTMLVFTQREGFSEIPSEEVFPDRRDSDDGAEPLETCLRRCGYEPRADSGWNLGERSMDESSGHAVRVYARYAGSLAKYRYVVRMSDGNDDGWDWCAVGNLADLAALRIALAPVVVLRALDDLELLSRAAEGAYHAWHGHELHDCCPHCFPYEYEERQRQQRLRREAVQRKAEEAKKKAEEEPR